MLTNNGNVSLTLAVWLASDDYDLSYDPDVISATGIMKSIRSIVLSRRQYAAKKGASKDLLDVLASRLGTAVHTAVETAWLYKYQHAMEKLGYPQHVIDRIRINPEEPDPKNLNIYMEIRSSKKIEGMTISGKFDRVEEGRVKDVKTTKVYSWIKGSNNAKYALQGSIYRWLNQDIITDDHMDVEYMFTDWKGWEVSKDDYPPLPLMTKTLPLMSIKATEEYLRGRIRQLRIAEQLPQEELPLCTPEELWQNPSRWAFWGKATNKQATKVFDTHAEALDWQAAKGGIGLIKENQDEPTFCKYCDAREACTQAEGFIASGLLKL
jgi:hypothetical protein